MRFAFNPAAVWPKTMQEVTTLLVFSGFSVFWLGESPTWNHAIGSGLIEIGASFIFRG